MLRGNHTPHLFVLDGFFVEVDQHVGLVASVVKFVDCVVHPALHFLVEDSGDGCEVIGAGQCDDDRVDVYVDVGVAALTGPAYLTGKLVFKILRTLITTVIKECEEVRARKLELGDTLPLARGPDRTVPVSGPIPSADTLYNTKNAGVDFRLRADKAVPVWRRWAVRTWLDVPEADKDVVRGFAGGPAVKAVFACPVVIRNWWDY